MALGPGEGSEIIRPEQVPAGSFGVDGGNGRGIKLPQGAKPGPMMGGDGIDLIRRVVAHEKRERVLGRLMARCGELSHDELRHKGIISDELAMLDGGYYNSGDGGLDITGICAASNGEVMTMVEELGFSVRDRGEIGDFLEEHYGRGSKNRHEAGRKGVGEEEKERAAVRERVIWDRMIGGDLMGDIGVSALWDDAADARAMEDEDIAAHNMLDGVVDVDGMKFEDSDKPEGPLDLGDELELWTGVEDSEPDDIANLFEQLVEGVLARNS